MPRRPRPAHRPAPKHAQGDDERKIKSNTTPAPKSSARKENSAQKSANIPAVSKPGQQKRQFENVEPSSDESEGEDVEEEDSEENEFEEGSSMSGGLEMRSGDEDQDFDEDEDADAPRVVAWDGDDLRYDSSSGEDEDEDDEDGESEEDEPKQQRKGKPKKEVEDRLQSRLGDIPLGALRKAQAMLGRAESDSDSGSEEDSEEEPDALDSKGKNKEREKVEWSAKPRKDIAKRKDKHAPMEMSSKKPVPRRRQVVEVPKIVARDPRFLPTAGELSTSKFQQNYSFLNDKHQKELAELKATLKTARKRLPSTPRDTREEAEQEVRRLELAVKRAESAVNKDRLDRIQRETMSNVKKEEAGKRQQGKGEWYLKKGEKREIMVKARYDALAKEGGQRAVKKAIEKKQKKLSQKEKRSRPEQKRRRME